MSRLARIVPLKVLLVLAVAPLVAGSVATRVIEFNLLSLGSGSGDWLECAIELEVRRDAGDPSRKRPEYLDDLAVSLMLGVESPVDGRATFEFFKAEAALVTLKEGRHIVRFYLPPEVVERDRIRNEVHSFVVQLSRSGEVVVESVSRQLERTNVRDSFLKRIDLEAAKNDGILLPQFKTPFFAAYPQDTPSFRDSDAPVAATD